MPATNPENITDLIKQFGPFKLIDRKREAQLLREGKHCHILAVVSYDVDYADLPEEERPSDEELKDRGETKEEYKGYGLCVEVGHHIVNVDEIYESQNPMPEELVLEGNENVWFGDDGLPNP